MPQTFHVVNHVPRKRWVIGEEEKLRFRRFLGSKVEFTRMSFEFFAKRDLPRQARRDACTEEREAQVVGEQVS